MSNEENAPERLPATIEPETAEQALMMLDRARVALDAALDYQQVRHCRTLAVAAAAYAREAKDSTLIEKATRLKVQAERRAGAMLIESGEKGERATSAEGGRRGMASRYSKPRNDDGPYLPTLSDIGVTTRQSSDWQALARLSEEEFVSAVDAVAAADGRVTTAQVIATALASRPASAARRRAANEEEADDMGDDKPKRRKSAAQAAREHRRAVLAEAEPASRVVSLANGLRRELDSSSEPFNERERQAMVALGLAYQRRLDLSPNEEKGP